jgi:hypothetical protein
MLAQAWRGREWGVVLLVAAGLALTGCGGANIKDLLKDSPSQEDKPAQ